METFPQHHHIWTAPPIWCYYGVFCDWFSREPKHRIRPFIYKETKLVWQLEYIKKLLFSFFITRSVKMSISSFIVHVFFHRSAHNMTIKHLYPCIMSGGQTVSLGHCLKTWPLQDNSPILIVGAVVFMYLLQGLVSSGTLQARCIAVMMMDMHFGIMFPLSTHLLINTRTAYRCKTNTIKTFCQVVNGPI